MLNPTKDHEDSQRISAKINKTIRRIVYPGNEIGGLVTHCGLGSRYGKSAAKEGKRLTCVRPCSSKAWVGRDKRYVSQQRPKKDHRSGQYPSQSYLLSKNNRCTRANQCNARRIRPYQAT